MNLFPLKISILLFVFCSPDILYGQESGFDSFISRISREYKVDIALAPELLPALDSIHHSGPEITNIENLLHQLLAGRDISYQIVDGNKLMLRREPEFQEGSGIHLLQGMIADGRDGSPLPFAAVSLLETNRGTYTDENGLFALAINDTTGSVLVSYLGFKQVTVPIASFMGKMQTIQMQLNNIPLKQVVIVVPFQQTSFDEETQSIDLKGYQFISSEELLRGTSEQLMDHLIGYTHFSSEQGIHLRGSEAENSLILMDGLPVYDPYHFYNIFSAFNGHYFSSVKLYKNNMPVEFGGRIDGLIRIDSEVKNHGSKLILDTDLLLSSLTGVLALSNKVEFMAGARVSHTGMLNEALKDSTVANFSVPGQFKSENEWSSTQQPTFNFYDVNCGLRAGIGNKTNMMLSYFKNHDHLENIFKTDLETSLPGNEKISIMQSVETDDKWSNEGVSIDVRAPGWNNATLNFNGFISSFEKSSSYYSSLREHRPLMNRVAFNKGSQESQLQTVGIKAFITDAIPGDKEFKAGVDLQYHSIDLLAVENNSPYLIEAQTEYEATLFGDYRISVLENLDWTIGGRLTYLNSTSAIYPLPHMQINYSIGDHWRLKTAYSKNIQDIQELTVENRFGREVNFLALSQPEAGYPVLQSDKYMTGAGYTSDNLIFDAELFYKKIDGLINVRALKPDPSFQDQTSPGEFYRLFTGEGWTAGLDVLLVYKKNNLESSVSYTLSKISQRFDMLFNGNSFSPQEDRRHQVKASAEYKMGKFTASSLLNYKTKAPYLSLVRLEGGDGIGMVDQGTVFRYLPPYFSFDLGLDFSFNCFHQPARIGISLINATNHENINDLQHVGKVTREGSMGGLYLTQETELLGRTVNVFFRYLIQ